MTITERKVEVVTAQVSSKGYSPEFKKYQETLYAEYEKYILPLLNPFKVSLSKFIVDPYPQDFSPESPELPSANRYSDKQIRKSPYLLGNTAYIRLKKTTDKEVNTLRKYVEKVYKIKSLPKNYSDELLDFDFSAPDARSRMELSPNFRTYVKTIITTPHFSIAISYVGNYDSVYFMLYFSMMIPKEDSFVHHVKEEFNFTDSTDDTGALTRYSELGAFFGNLVYGWIRSQKIPVGMDVNYDFSPIPENLTGLYRLLDGSVIELNNVTDKARAIFKNNISTGRSAQNRNRIIGIDYESSAIYFINSGDDVDSFSFAGASKIENSDKMRWINAPLDILINPKKDGLANIYDFNSLLNSLRYHEDPKIQKTGLMLLTYFQKILDEKNVEGAFDKNPEAKSMPKDTEEMTLGDAFFLYPEYTKSALDALEMIGKSRYGKIVPINYLRFMGTIHMLQTLVGKEVKTLRIQSYERRKQFESATAQDLPPIPYVNEGINLFPHQAEGLAKLAASPESAVVDVSTGGGKTPFGIYDALIQIAKGNVSRCLFIVPLSLIGQWISQIRFFTQGQVNVIPITTDSVNSFGEDRIESMCQSAPPNTLFITSMSYLSSSALEISKGIFAYPRAEWLRETVKPDYIWIDESHKIKSQKTHVYNAVAKLGSDVKVKRIATGTLINNKPIDLVGQIGFLNPNVIGNERKFKQKYMEDGVYKKNFVSLIRRDLRENINYIIYRKKDWAACLPKFKYSYDFVDMPNAQASPYRKLVLEILEEIQNDAELSRAWESLINSGGEDLEIPVILLGKLARLEQYLTAPEISPVLKQLGGDAIISPKVGKMDEYIAQSIKNNSKVIVACHYKISALHLMNHSKFKSYGVYYDASHKNAIRSFLNDDKIKVLFAVQQSLKEGFNLQVADRILVMDVDWTPGSLEQLIARILRPNLEWRDGKMINKNLNKTIYVNTILCNGSADIAKYSFQAYKKILNAKIMENCPVDTVSPPDFSEEGLCARYGSPLVGGTKTVEALKEFETWETELIEDQRNKGVIDFQKPEIGKVFKSSSIMDNLPWERGMDLPCEPNEMPLSEWLRDNDSKGNSDLTEFKSELMGKVVNTQFGRGVIIGVRRNSVRVENEKGDKWSNNVDVTVIRLDSSKEDLPKVVEEDKKVAKETPPTETKPRVNVSVPKTAPLSKGIDPQDVKEQKVTLALLNALGEKYGYKLKVTRGELSNTYNWYSIKEKVLGPDIIMKRVSEHTKDWWIESLNRASVFIKRGRAVPAPEIPVQVKEQVSTLIKKTATKIAKKEKKAQEENEDVSFTGKDSQLDISIAVYNDIPCLIANPSDPDSEDLTEFNFQLMGKMWMFPVESKQYGMKCLSILNNKFTINPINLEECRKFLDGVTSGRYPTKFPRDARNFMRLRLKKAAPGSLKIYPLVINKKLYFVVDASSHPTISLRPYRFDLVEGFWCYMGVNASSLALVVKKIQRKFTISNIDTLRKTAAQTFKIKI